MKIGIDGSRAFLKNRTGIEEYSYQTIKHLKDKLKDHQVVLFLRKNQKIDFELPANWKVKIINWPRLWTQLGLSIEMILNPVDALFIPAHTVPFIHSKKTVVVVHGLEYEFCPAAYSAWERFYMRFCIKNSCKWADKIISVSENTKKDLINLYKVDEKKIEVVYEGYDCYQSSDNSHQEQSVSLMLEEPFILFIGRIEERKNIKNVVKAFEILKKKYNVAHKLILAGRRGYGYEEIKNEIAKCKYKEDIVELGFVSENEKWELLKKADVFVFATQYEGFGIPILEAQSVGCPVIAANNSSVPEVVCDTAILTNSLDANDISKKIFSLMSNETLKNAIIKKGLENVKRFSWDKCADNLATIIKINE